MGDALAQSRFRGGKDVDTLAADFFSGILGHLKYTLREKLGDGVMTSTPFEIVVTVPAIWSDLAKDKTRQACLQGLRNALPEQAAALVHLISEPEAAAIYAMHGLDPHGLKIGESFVICDAGGGTVDLISYTVTNLLPILEVQEAAPGTGALCGSTFLNLRFEKFLKAKLGKQKGFDDDVLAEAMERFEKTIKRQFTMSAVAEGDTYTIPVGGLANNKALGINRGRYALQAADLQTVFEPVIQMVIELVKGQITSSKVSINAVLLVGGFGASNYLKERLREAIDDKIRVMQPSNAWLAVVQGAVMKGLAQCSPDNLTMVRIQNRKARNHYGTDVRVEYNPTQHRGMAESKSWDGFENCWQVPAMSWFIRQGDDVSENRPYKTPFVSCQLVSDGKIKNLQMEVFTDRTDRVAPVARDGNVQLLCRVEADLSNIPESQMEKKTGKDGQVSQMH
jgi:hypothetical protein